MLFFDLQDLQIHFKKYNYVMNQDTLVGQSEHLVAPRMPMTRAGLVPSHPLFLSH